MILIVNKVKNENRNSNGVGAIEADLIYLQNRGLRSDRIKLAVVFSPIGYEFNN